MNGTIYLAITYYPNVFLQDYLKAQEIPFNQEDIIPYVIEGEFPEAGKIDVAIVKMRVCAYSRTAPIWTEHS